MRLAKQAISIGGTFACALMLPSCDRASRIAVKPKAPPIIETQWTRAAAERTERLTEAALKRDPVHGGDKYGLPQLRVYASDGRLVYMLSGGAAWSPQTIGAAIDKAIQSGATVPAPTLQETLSDLQAPDRRPASAVVAARGTPLVFDYWASWCVPCKMLEKALLDWQASKPRGAVQIVKAEADLTKLSRERGEKVFMMKKGPDGKMRKIEMK